MRAVLIDPYAHLTPGRGACEEIEIEDSLAAMYRALSDSENGHACSMVEVATQDAQGNVYWVDEEGLMKGHSGFVVLAGAHQPFAGRMLITGSTPDGGNADIATDFLELARRVGTVQAFPGGANVGLADGEDWLGGHMLGNAQKIAADLQEHLEERLGISAPDEAPAGPGL